MSVPAPHGCIETSPDSRTVKLGGKFISLTALSRMQGLHIVHLSNVLSGKRPATMKTVRKIAAGLGMTVDDLLMAIEDRKNDIQEKRGALQRLHDERVLREDTEDLTTLRRGQIPVPRLPGLRLS